jgi:hypothetical protein
MPHKNRFPVDAKVRFTQERLSVLMLQDRRRLEGRIGIVQGYWQGTRKPTVYFPQDGARSDLRLLQLDPRHLELIGEISADSESQDHMVDKASDDEEMSQKDLDDLFG